MEHSCDFCKLLEKAETNPDWIATFYYSIAFLYPNQFYRGRVVIIFKRHVEDLLELTMQESYSLYSEMLQVAKAVREVIHPERINFALLGNRIPHLHWHIIPRFLGDYQEGKAPWPHPTHLLSEEEYRNLASQVKKHIERK